MLQQRIESRHSIGLFIGFGTERAFVSYHGQIYVVDNLLTCRAAYPMDLATVQLRRCFKDIMPEIVCYYVPDDKQLRTPRVRAPRGGYGSPALVDAKALLVSPLASAGNKFSSLRVNSDASRPKSPYSASADNVSEVSYTPNTFNDGAITIFWTVVRLDR